MSKVYSVSSSSSEDDDFNGDYSDDDNDFDLKNAEKEDIPLDEEEITIIDKGTIQNPEQANKIPIEVSSESESSDEDVNFVEEKDNSKKQTLQELLEEEDSDDSVQYLNVKESDDSAGEPEKKQSIQELSDSSDSELELNIIEPTKSQDDQNNEDMELLKKIIIPYEEIIQSIQPYNNVVEALSKITDNQLRARITSAATKLLFYRKFDIYECEHSNLVEELESLKNKLV